MKVKSERLGAHGWMNGLLSFLLLFPMFLLDAQIQPPTFTNCTDIEVCSYGTKDELVHADIQAEVVNHCVTNPGLYWTTHIDLHSDGSIDQTTTKSNASGEYPLGVHTITFWAADGCGGISSCKRVVTVKDCQKPTPVCLDITIASLPSTGVAEIWSLAFESGYSYDNITDQDSIQFLVERMDQFSFSQQAPDQDAGESVIISCLDMPPNTISPIVEIALWAGDEAGNWDYCVTMVKVEDWGPGCIPLMPTITSYFTNEGLEPIGLVSVNITSPNGNLNALTPNNGIFTFYSLGAQEYTIIPLKDINPMNGVNSYDLFLMQKHLLGIKPLASPYKLIAADINNNCEVSVADMIALRKMILDPINVTFKNNNSWRFVDYEYLFPYPQQPCGFPEEVVLNTQGSNSEFIWFVGIKIGDVSGDHTPDNLVGTDIRNQSKALSFQVEDKSLASGQEYTVEFTAQDFQEIEAYQYTLDFNTDLLEFVDITPAWSDLSAANFSTTRTTRGMLTTSWNGAEPTSLSDGESLFIIRFRAKADVLLSQALILNSRLTPAVAYQHDGQEMDAQLQFVKRPEVATTFELYQNEPNPFGDLTRIGFNLPEAGVSTLTIHDVTGQVVYRATGEFAHGYNAFVIQGSELPGQGMMYYTLQSGDHIATKPMTMKK